LRRLCADRSDASQDSSSCSSLSALVALSSAVTRHALQQGKHGIFNDTLDYVWRRPGQLRFGIRRP
jgi:hypothetical protein